MPKRGWRAESDSGPERARLRADCARCFGLCCVAPAFSASADFAIDKPAGQACPHLRADFGCSIHEQLRPRGFPGCTVYDCFGAGQQVARVTFGGRDWRTTPGIAEQMFGVFAVMRQLHELLWYLSEALTLPAARPLYGPLRRALAETERLTGASPDTLAGLDVNSLRTDINALLLRASELARAQPGRPGGASGSGGSDGSDGSSGPGGSGGRGDLGRSGTSLRGANLVGRDLRGADLIGRDLRSVELGRASLRGAYLTGADLRGADLSTADLTGADLRGADLAGADLRETLFLTQSQLESASGDRATRLPRSLGRPAHWQARR